MKRKNIFKLFVSSLLVAPQLALAQAGRIIPKPISGLPGNQNSTFGSELDWYIRTFLIVVGLIAVAFIIYGGFRYIISAGNEEATEAAKKTLQNAIIGLVVVILSYIIVVVIANALFGRI